jgi:bifunctional non-homologous end joining protein LigD
MLAYKDGARVRLVSRNGVDHTARFRDLAAAVAKLRAPRLILDGEVAVFDEGLVLQFHLLGEPTENVACTAPVYMAFDCLHVRGVDARGLPLRRRREMLEEEIAGARLIYTARRLADDGHTAWSIVAKRGYEGMVAKDPDTAYRGGATRSWLKVKVRHERGFVIGASCPSKTEAAPRSSTRWRKSSCDPLAK